MSNAPNRPTLISDYSDILAGGVGLPVPVVVGGQAANAWALFYSKRVGRNLKRYSPFTSKDLDITGDRRLLEHIRRITNGTVRYSEPRSPVIGYVEASLGDSVRRIEVMRDVKGLGRDELSDSIEVSIGGVTVHLLAPFKVLKAKICNTIALDQDERNDVNHVHIMILCVREFVLDILREAIGGRTSQRDAVDMFEELREVVLSTEAKKSAAMWNFKFGSVWPLDDMTRCGLQKILRFVEYRLKPDG